MAKIVGFNGYFRSEIEHRKQKRSGWTLP